MTDVCLVTEGNWPLVTGGLSTWTQHFIACLRNQSVKVLTLPGAKGSLTFSVSDAVSDCAVPWASLPKARRYIASGLDAALWLVTVAPDKAKEVVYVEHGDIVSEVRSCGCTEGAKVVEAPDRSRQALGYARLRRKITQTVGLFVGVTRRACRRAYREGARAVLYAPNAVPPIAEDKLQKGRSNVLTFVGRNDPIKGVDRFAKLASRVGTTTQMSLLSESERWVAPVFGRFDTRLNPVDPWERAGAVVALPSRLEACPFVALEAEARGITAIVSAVADIEESELIRKVPWNLSNWARLVERCLDSSSPSEASFRTRQRWQEFENVWNRVASDEWGKFENSNGTWLRTRR